MRPREPLPRYGRRSREEDVNYDQYDEDGQGYLAPSATLGRRRGHSRDTGDSYENGFRHRYDSWNSYGYEPRHQQSRSQQRAQEAGSTWRHNRGYTAGIRPGYGNHPSASVNRGFDYEDNREQDFNARRNQNFRDEYPPASSYYQHYDYTHSYEHRYLRPETHAHNHYGLGGPARSYHSSTSTPYANATSGNDTDNATSSRSSTNRLFQHRNSYARAHPFRSLPSHRRAPYQREMPGPSEEYLKTSLEKSETVSEGADVNVEGLVRKLVVLDLNGTLVYRSPHRSWRDRHLGHAAGGANAMTEEDLYAQFEPSQPRPLRVAHPRPYVTSFQNYLFHPNTKRWLDTMVWSSAQPHSVADMVEKCFGDRRGELVAIWARDRLGLDANDYGRKVQTMKDLNKLWSELNATSFVDEAPSTSSNDSSSSQAPQRRFHSAKTTLLLDDSPLKAQLQPYNHLCLKEYDIEMRKHDMAVRELEIAGRKLADALAEKESMEDSTLDQDKDIDERYTPDENAQIDANVASVNPAAGAEVDESIIDAGHIPATADGSARKRKRKEKKENKKKDRFEERLKKLTEEGERAYDETLLAVVGVLDAVKKETNVAAWIRSGELIRSLPEVDSGRVRGSSVETTSLEEDEKGPRKKIRLSEQDGEGKKPLEEDDSVSSGISDHQLPPHTSSPIRETSFPPSQDDRGVKSDTERTGVPLDQPRDGNGAEEGIRVQDQLWFNHPGTVAYWAWKGRKALEDLGIEAVPGVKGPTG